ncbi:hypothetical protein MET9862_04408 [Methylobacterium symbioticum]|uniref:Uncharacterized protein n=1 Tax=Methylobacterium symbioticum TaxID=2584084 RepID=A0A509EHZ7_9HYPH|nr:hypothetical protein MET9862_04408 [Methylobacterium symbioticum]
MLGAGLDGGRERQQVGLVAPRSDDIGEPRASLGQRAGLVEGDHADLAQALEGAAVAEQHAAARGPPGADHDRGRRGEAHGAGTGDDQNRDGVDQGVAERRLRAEGEPGEEGREAERHHSGHEPAGHPVEQGLDRQLGSLRRLDHAGDLREHRVGADRADAEVEAALPVDGAADGGAAGLLAHRHRFARHHALVHVAGARDHGSVRGDALAGPDADHVADAQRCERHFDLRPGPDHARGLRREVHQPGDGRAGAALGAGLHEPPEQDQGDDEGARLEIEMGAARGQDARRDGRDQRVEVGGAGAEGDEGVHVRVPAQKARDAAREEAPPRSGQDQGRQHGLNHRVAGLADPPGQRVVEAWDEVAAHVEDDDGQGEDRRGDDVPAQDPRLRRPPVGRRGVLGGGDGVARLPHGLFQARPLHDAVEMAHMRAARGEVHADPAHPGHGGEPPLHPPDAGGAAHPLDREHRLGLGHVVAGRGDGLGRRGRRGARRQMQGGAAAGEVDGDAARAGQRLQGALDPADAGGAGQALDREADGEIGRHDPHVGLPIMGRSRVTARRPRQALAGGGSAAGCAARSGRTTRTRVPSPRVLSMTRRPRCRFRLCFTMARPRPVPPCCRLEAVSTR